MTPQHARQTLVGPHLLCLDFDLTITQTHLFRYTANAIHEGWSRQDAILRSIELYERQGARGGDDLWRTLYHWLSAGHGLAVTSFTAFPELVAAALTRGVAPMRALGASRDITRYMSRPLIIYGDPAPDLNPPRELPGTSLVRAERGGLSDKNRHIERALKLNQAQGRLYEGVLLLDDDPRNIEHALEAGYLAIHVSSDPSDHSPLENLGALC